MSNRQYYFRRRISAPKQLSLPAGVGNLVHRVKSLLFQLFTKRGLLILAGIFVCIYAIVVLIYVQTIPDIGLQTVFSTKLKISLHNEFNDNQTVHPMRGDEIVRIGDNAVNNWADVLQAPFTLRDNLVENSVNPPTWPSKRTINGAEVYLVKVEFQRGNDRFTYLCPLKNLPLKDLVPSVLWFCLKMLLFSIGALVLWKRPADAATAQFFILCLVTLGAYMGGYHWNHIATQPALNLVFMVCAVLLPVVSLHFYIVFPRKKTWLVRHPRLTLTGIYGLPLVFLAAMMFEYFYSRWLARSNSASFDDALDALRYTIYAYLCVASLWYLACVGCLVHSFCTVNDPTEHNQVKWIMFGAVAALVPIGYSLYLALFDSDAFAAGAATWPMFAASAFLTGAFAVSITRYRLMELDKLVSSGFGYFMISFLAGLVYYAVVFVGTLAFNQVFAGPKLTEALSVSTTALILMLLLDMARSRFKKALDRRFSRDKSQLDRTLQQLSQAVQQLVDPPALAQRLLHATTELMGVARGSVFFARAIRPCFASSVRWARPRLWPSYRPAVR